MTQALSEILSKDFEITNTQLSPNDPKISRIADLGNKRCYGN